MTTCSASLAIVHSTHGARICSFHNIQVKIAMLLLSSIILGQYNFCSKHSSWEVECSTVKDGDLTEYSIPCGASYILITIVYLYSFLAHLSLHNLVFFCFCSKWVSCDIRDTQQATGTWHGGMAHRTEAAMCPLVSYMFTYLVNRVTVAM